MTPRRGASGVLRLATGLLLLLGLAACATVPRASLPKGAAITALIPAKADLFASIRVAANQQLVAELFKRDGVTRPIPKSILSKTSDLYVAASAAPSGKLHYVVLARGRFPVGLARWQFFWNREWQRNAEPLPWWHDKKTGAEVAFVNRELVMIADSGLPAMLSRIGTSTPSPLSAEVRRLFDNSDVALYLPRVTGSNSLFGLDPKRFPIASVRVALTRAAQSEGKGSVPPSYNAVALFTMKSARDARLFSVVFRLLVAGAGSGSAIAPFPLSGGTVSVNGSVIDLTGVTITESQLVDLFGRFMKPNRAQSAPSKAGTT